MLYLNTEERGMRIFSLSFFAVLWYNIFEIFVEKNNGGK